MASVPPTDEAFLREVDEALREDQLLGFWNKWGKPLIAAIVVGLAAWAGWLWWQAQRAEAAGLEGETLYQTVDGLTKGNDSGATQNLAKLAGSDNIGYQATAKLVQAGIALEKGDNQGAAKQFAAVAADTSLEQPWRDIALIRQTAIEFDTLKPEEVINRMKPLAVAGKPWFGSAGEMVALAYIRMNKQDLAGKIFADLAKDEQVPETIRSRAQQMAGAMGIAPAAKAVLKDKGQ